jgi:hypothetical protein
MFKPRRRATGIRRATPFPSSGAKHMPNLPTRRAILAGIPLALVATTVSAGLFSQDIPENLDLALGRPTDAHHYTVAIGPVEPEVRIGRMHAWTLALADRRGRPIDTARIAIDGRMPQHGHGLPSAPAVTQALGDGQFLIEGMKFNMHGWWEIDLAIDGPAGADTVSFNLVL